MVVVINVLLKIMPLLSVMIWRIVSIVLIPMTLPKAHPVTRPCVIKSMGARSLFLNVVDVVANTVVVAVVADVVDNITMLLQQKTLLLTPKNLRITRNLTTLKSSRWVMHSPLLLLPNNPTPAVFIPVVVEVTIGFNGFVVVVVEATFPFSIHTILKTMNPPMQQYGYYFQSPAPVLAAAAAPIPLEAPPPNSPNPASSDSNNPSA
jgi:hypothetical protein